MGMCHQNREILRGEWLRYCYVSLNVSLPLVLWHGGTESCTWGRGIAVSTAREQIRQSVAWTWRYWWRCREVGSFHASHVTRKVPSLEEKKLPHELELSYPHARHSRGTRLIYCFIPQTAGLPVYIFIQYVFYFYDLASRADMFIGWERRRGKKQFYRLNSCYIPMR